MQTLYMKIQSKEILDKLLAGKKKNKVHKKKDFLRFILVVS